MFRNLKVWPGTIKNSVGRFVGGFQHKLIIVSKHLVLRGYSGENQDDACLGFTLFLHMGFVRLYSTRTLKTVTNAQHCILLANQHFDKGGLTHVEVEPILWLHTKQIIAGIKSFGYSINTRVSTALARLPQI